MAGLTGARGYGTAHQRLRRIIGRQVALGGVRCWRCGELIDPAGPWDLGHDDDDRSRYRGPEHRDCNRRAGAVNGNRARRRILSRRWW